MKRTLLLVLVLVAAFDGLTTSVAHAQTRLGLEVGTYVPVGDLGDAADNSLWLGARAELQAVNALGQVAALSFVLQGGYSSLEFENPAADEVVDGSYYEIGAGARVYSMALPFFISAGLAYSSYDFGDTSEGGISPSIGAGMSFGLGGVFMEFEARGRVSFLGDEAGYDPRFVTLTAAVGLPF